MTYKWKPSKSQRREFAIRMQDPVEAANYEQRKLNKIEKRRASSNFDYSSAGGDWYGDRIVWAGDYADNEPDKDANLYDLCTTVKKRHTKVKYFRYILNMDTLQYVDKRKVPVTDKEVNNGKTYCSRIHPLPLLTCEGNGRGGGDFHGESPLIGLWARQRITVSNEIPEGYTELKFDLTE